MISQDTFLAAVAKECAIIKHLIGQVPEGGWDYRPTPAQRSTLELVRYLAHCPYNVVVYATTGSWDRWDPIAAKVADLGPAELAKTFDKQARDIAKLLKPITDARMRKATVKDFAGKTVPLAQFLLGSVLGILTAYRMQLFLYAKSAGNAAIGTSDCWMGKTAKPAKAKTA